MLIFMPSLGKFMNINDRLYAVYLIDYYGPLLTEHQLAILNEYYDNDLSMQEIAENHQISKSAVADIIKRSFVCIVGTFFCGQLGLVGSCDF